MKGKVLITGATGFIGSHLAMNLLKEGYSVHGVTRGGEPALDLPPSITLHTLDLADRRAVERLVREVSPEYLFHLAARTFPEEAGDEPSRDLFIRDNLTATLNLLDGMSRQWGGGRFIHVGTCGEYGDNPSPLREEMPPSPLTFYALTKTWATLAAIYSSRALSLRVTVLRPFLTYGPGQRAMGRFIPSAIHCALTRREFSMTDGSMVREFNHVQDTVRGMILAMDAPTGGGEVINICSGRGMTLKEAALTIFETAGADPSLIRLGAVERRKGEPQAFYGSPERGERLLGYKPSIGFREGIRETLEWYRRDMTPFNLDPG